jgi:hypothetical protein
MLNANPFSFRFFATAFLVAMIAAFISPMQAQDATGSSAPKGGFVDDWTYHHLLFSNPGTREDAVKNGELDKWLKVTSDPRYQMQQAKRHMGTPPVVAATGAFRKSEKDNFSDGIREPLMGWNSLRTSSKGVKKDWSQSLGSVSTAAALTVAVGTLSSSSISGGSQFTIDGMTFDASAPTAASETGTFTGNPTSGQTATINGVALTASVSTKATRTGTFSSLPQASSTITVVNGATLSLTTNATVASAIGTVAASPTSTTAPTIAITNGVNGNVLTLTTNATAAHATGTITASSVGPASGQTVKITNGLNSNTLTLTGGSGGTGTITVSGRPGNSDTPQSARRNTPLLPTAVAPPTASTAQEGGAQPTSSTLKTSLQQLQPPVARAALQFLATAQGQRQFLTLPQRLPPVALAVRLRLPTTPECR